MLQGMSARWKKREIYICTVEIIPPTDGYKSNQTSRSVGRELLLPLALFNYFPSNKWNDFSSLIPPPLRKLSLFIKMKNDLCKSQHCASASRRGRVREKLWQLCNLQFTVRRVTNIPDIYLVLAISSREKWLICRRSHFVFVQHESHEVARLKLRRGFPRVTLLASFSGFDSPGKRLTKLNNKKGPEMGTHIKGIETEEDH